MKAVNRPYVLTYEGVDCGTFAQNTKLGSIAIYIYRQHLIPAKRFLPLDWKKIVNGNGGLRIIGKLTFG